MKTQVHMHQNNVADHADFIDNEKTQVSQSVAQLVQAVGREFVVSTFQTFHAQQAIEEVDAG